MPSISRARFALAAIASALFLVSTICGCAKVLSYWPRQIDFTPPPAPISSRPMEIESSGMAHPLERRRNPNATANKTGAAPAPPAALGNTGNNKPSAAPDVTLAGESATQAATEQLLDETGRRLAHIDHSALSIQDQAAWKQAANFVSAGRQALANRDYLAASGYAQKASALVSKLPVAPQ